MYFIGYVALLPGVVDGASAACLYENGEGGTSMRKSCIEFFPNRGIPSTQATVL
jgi:hypothetical protein